ncbi:MAG: branched-chain amino acid aminotransferase [Clostridia bacterium]|nr:branched-chain amino acid aminotransferase [Clostridia bacterium]
MEIKVTKTTNPKVKPDGDDLNFGSVFTDHMLLIDYMEGEGWKDARIIPYQDICLDPASSVFHYGVEIFEGMKAYYAPDGRLLLFRPEANAHRLNSSAARLLIPELPVEMFLEGLLALVNLDRDWVPKRQDQSLYIRPFLFATEPQLGVSRSRSYTFCIILSPVGAYYPEGLDPVKIYVETDYARSVQGGTGHIKCGGNYAGSLAAQYKAKQFGYSQVLWLDGAERKYIDEVGTMNVMFVIGDEVLTPELSGTILPGITRDSVLHLLRDWGVRTTERRISLDELLTAAKNGRLREAFGVGTAAVISPIGEFYIRGERYRVGNGHIGLLSQKIYNNLTDIQWGRIQDKFGWTMEVK